MASRSVQFRGIAAVLNAYERADIAPFAIKCDQQLIIKYSEPEIEGGKQFLKQALTELSTGGALATYTLCVYEDLPKGEKINSKTPFDMSFNFKLEDDYQEARAARYGGGSLEYEKRIEALEKRLLDMQDEEEDEEPAAVGGALGAFHKLMDNPQIAAAISGKVVSFIQSFGVASPGQVAPVVHAAKIAGVVDEKHNADQLAKIQRAIDSLVQVDPLLGDHLIAIADIAAKDLGKYNLLIGML